MSDVYDLVIGDRGYSSWSLRGWLLFDAFNIPCRVHTARLYTDELPELLKAYHPARTAPTIRTPDGVVMPESLAIAEELADRHPDAGIWPKGRARAVARVLAAEMHAGFTALRGHCPMNLRVSYTDCAAPQGVLDDLRRLETVWAWAWEETDSREWLCGPYSAADVFFAPVTARIIGYDLPVSNAARAYCEATISDPAFREWRAEGQKVTYDPFPYETGLPTRPWPGT